MNSSLQIFQFFYVNLRSKMVATTEHQTYGYGM
jgi:hypothetical protein